jgi:hypothetical protein
LASVSAPTGRVSGGPLIAAAAVVSPAASTTSPEFPSGESATSSSFFILFDSVIFSSLVYGCHIVWRPFASAGYYSFAGGR